MWLGTRGSCYRNCDYASDRQASLTNAEEQSCYYLIEVIVLFLPKRLGVLAYEHDAQSEAC
jgi:hypothetical protein